MKLLVLVVHVIPILLILTCYCSILFGQYLPHLGYKKRIHLMNPMVPGLTGSKMSASEPESKIDLLDSVEDVKRKIRKAYCEPGKVEGNGVLAFAQHVLFPILAGEDMVIERPEKFGGLVTFNTYKELEAAYIAEEVYPLDLKNGVANQLNQMLEPIRQKFSADPSIQSVRKRAYPVEEGKCTGAKGCSSERAIDVSRLDIRVGKIISAVKHSNADTLYVETVDIGGETRTAVSGLAQWIPVEELQDRLVVVICNLKPVNMRGIKSEAMLLAASKDNKVELLDPPSDSEPGECITVLGYERERLGVPDKEINSKKKIFEQIQADLQTTLDCCAAYKGICLCTTKGNVTVKTLVSASIK